MKNCLKCNDNLNVATVFSCIEGTMIHIANIDKRTQRIYTTKDGYDLIATELFKQNHNYEWADDDVEKTPYRKFSVSVSFDEWELLPIISMCSRELVF